MEIKNLKKAAGRIKKAIKEKERIILCGDGDLDGVSALVILKESISNLGGKASSVYFPDREKEGYGLTNAALKFFKQYAPALLIILDSGIGNIKEVREAKNLGFKVIIIDHHEILGKLPEADIIVDLKQKGEKYPFKEFATVGIAFKLAEILLSERMTESLRNNFLELTALATIADMMPRKDDNKDFIEKGLPLLEKSWRPGIKSFFAAKEIKELPSLNHKVSRMISVLNVRDIRNKLPVSYRFLEARTKREAEKLIKTLFKKSQARKKKTEKIIWQVEKEIIGRAEKLVFAGSEDFESVLMSSAASIICREYKIPVFLYKKMQKESLGTVRAPSGVDTVVLMKRCSKYLLTFGGHPQASGFRIKNENLEEFKKCLIKNYA